MNKIPKIIHQIWSGVNEPLPDFFRRLSETWKKHHPDWEYMFWDNDKMNDFIRIYYPQYVDIYNNFSFNVQRWDAIRYLILDRIGGLYVDFDAECLESHNELFKDKTCCFSLEPDGHLQFYDKKFFFNNALMASVPGHPFMKEIIDMVFIESPKIKFSSSKEKGDTVMLTTGPLALINLYEKSAYKNDVYLIPAKYVSPLTQMEVVAIKRGEEREEFEQKLNDAYSIHYFFNTWLHGIDVES